MNEYNLWISFDNELKEQYKSFAKRKNFPKKTFLVNEGEVCKEIFFIEQGILRSWFNDEGNDVTFQFFFEGSFVSSFESFRNNRPCLYNIETLTPSIVYVLQRDVFYKFLEAHPQLEKTINEFLVQRLYHYQKLFISRITHSPQRRYEELLKENPEIIKRVPQHYIATYLGVTPVTLSRIKTKLTKGHGVPKKIS